MSIQSISYVGIRFGNQNTLFSVTIKTLVNAAWGIIKLRETTFYGSILLNNRERRHIQAKASHQKRGVYFSGLSLLYGLVTLLGDIWRKTMKNLHHSPATQPMEDLIKYFG